MRKLFYIILLWPVWSSAQSDLQGVIVEMSSENKEIPLPGANVYWLNTTIGDVTDFDGKFTIPYQSDYKKLVISYVGYKTDTLTISEPNPIRYAPAIKL